MPTPPVIPPGAALKWNVKEQLARVGRNEPCPCESGLKHKRCCWGKSFLWQRNSRGEVFKSITVPSEVAPFIERRRQQNVVRFGKEPDASSLIVPHLVKEAPEEVKRAMAATLEAAEIPSAMIYAFRKTGLIPTELNETLLSDAEALDWNAALVEYHCQHRPSAEEALALFVPSTMRRIYAKEEIQALFRAFWDLQEVKGVAKQSLLEIICDGKHLSPSKVNRASAAKKAQWCEELLEHPKMGMLLSQVFGNVYPNGHARCTAALTRAKGGARSTFEGFMQEGGLDRRDALLFLMIFWPADRIPVTFSGHVLFQGLALNGIIPPDIVEPNRACN